MKLIQRIIFEIIRFPFAMAWRLAGWRINIDEIPDDKVVLTGSPHTSNWDYMHFLLAMLTLRRKIYVTIKKELFFPPLGWILKAFGGIPVDRHSSHNLVEELAERIEEADRIVFLFTPDGTRSYRPYWKTGFYWVAKEAGVPVMLGIPDYPKKSVFIGDRFHPSGDIEADFVHIREHQEKYGVGLYDEKTNPVITRAMYETQVLDVETDISSLEDNSKEDSKTTELSA